jgi:hypothetical protein
VLQGAEWIEAERVIRDLRSYERDAPPQLGPAVCDVWTESILSRRAETAEAIAA